MATITIGWRPSALPAAQLPTAKAHSLGLAGVRESGVALTMRGVNPIYVPVDLPHASGEPTTSTTQLNSSIGADSAATRPFPGANDVIGTTVSELAAGAIQRDGATLKAMVKGIDARGIPPRGRRKV
jgi:hypothetical protein